MKDSLGDRMKYYEAQPRSYLVPKVPVLIRLDGKAFHTLTRRMERPWDPRFQDCMIETAGYLAQHIAGCQLVYTQSDEISLLLTDYESVHTQGWFGYDLQKLVSVSASMAAVAFVGAYLVAFGAPDTRELPCFDARAWNVPREEVCNYMIWRQKDATRNSIQMLGQAHFSHKALHGKSCETILTMLQKKDILWQSCPTQQKRGTCLVRKESATRPGRRTWEVDAEIPIFTQDRDYIEKLVWPVDPAEAVTGDGAHAL